MIDDTARKLTIRELVAERVVCVVVEAAVAPVPVDLERHGVRYRAPPCEALAPAVRDAVVGQVRGEVVVVEPRVLPRTGQLAHVDDRLHPGGDEGFSGAQQAPAPLTIAENKTGENVVLALPTYRAGREDVIFQESPEALSARLIEGSTLGDPAVRRALWEGGLPAIQASTDPLIQHVLRTDPAARAAARKRWAAIGKSGKAQAALKRGRDPFA